MRDWKYTDKRPEVVCDTECSPNYWSIGFEDDSGKRVVLERLEDQELDRARVAQIFRNHRVFTFNGLSYDMLMIMYAMKGATNAELKRLNDTIIPAKGEARLKPWEIMENFGLEIPDWIDHIDLMPIAPAAAQKASLKKYAGMMHSRRMQELPYSPDTVLTPKQMMHVRSYHGNDLAVTKELRDELRPQIELRAIISEKYGIDMRSKSDAQCGEAVMRHMVEKRLPPHRDGTRQRIYKEKAKPGAFQYVAPKYIKFETSYMQQVFNELLRSKFTVRSDGYVEPPAMFGKKKKKGSGEDATELLNDGETYEGGSNIIIGEGVYKMGLGGLHSNESRATYVATKTLKIKDRDVTSYYPWLIINSGHEPANMAGHFTTVYKGIVLERVAAKARGDKSTAESLKIFVNGLFGKTGSPYSIVYAPRMMIQTTVTGQLSILMLIERLTIAGFKVVSANTDGLVTLVPTDRQWEFDAILFDWECDTGLDTEETEYSALYSRDVNNYLAVKPGKDGKVSVKRKGAYAPSGRGIPAAMGLKKTPDCEVCVDAVIAHLTEGKSIEDAVHECKDIRKFVTVRQVTGGAMKDGVFVGKVVRYYYSDDAPGPLLYKTSGNRVPSSEGAEPCMELPDEFPDNVNYDFYIREAYNILWDLGVNAPDYTLIGQKGISFAHRDGQKTLHTVDRSTGIAVCGAARKDRRENWNYFKSIPSDMRGCARCRKETDL